MATMAAQVFQNRIGVSQLAVGSYVYRASLPAASNQFIGVLKTANAVGATVTAVIEQSFNGEDWLPVYTLTSAGNGIDTDNSVQQMFGTLRATVTVAGAPAEVLCSMYYDPQVAR